MTSNSQSSQSPQPTSEAKKKKFRPPLERFSAMLREAADTLVRIDEIFGKTLKVDAAVAAAREAAAHVAGLGPDWKPSAPMRKHAKTGDFVPVVGDTVTFTTRGAKKYGDLFADIAALTVVRINNKEAVVQSKKGGKAMVPFTALVQVEEG